jgi:hypothetical protein
LQAIRSRACGDIARNSIGKRKNGNALVERKLNKKVHGDVAEGNQNMSWWHYRLLRGATADL